MHQNYVAANDCAGVEGFQVGSGNCDCDCDVMVMVTEVVTLSPQEHSFLAAAD